MLLKGLGRRRFGTKTFRPVRGTKDMFDEDIQGLRRIENIARSISQRFGFAEVSTPVLERTRVFTRTLGESSDVVNKEMYAFKDKSDENICLRPENTAGVMRALLHSRTSLLRSRPEKLFYAGPMFRRERPQRGRLRQFHQIGLEYCGTKHARADVEVIEAATEFLRHLELWPESLELQINSLGDRESRTRYEEEITKYFESHRSSLSRDSVERLNRDAPLRILDSKSEQDAEIISKAPGIESFLSQSASSHFQYVLNALNDAEISFTVNPRLVRGLDYYSHTAFEFVVKSDIDDANNGQAVLAGGRYDDLAKLLGSNQDIESVGWACGVERIQILRDALNIKTASRDPVVLVAGISSSSSCCDNIERHVDNICRDLRRVSPSPLLCVHRTLEISKLSKVFKNADRYQADFIITVGKEEMEQNRVSIRNVKTRDVLSNVTLESAIQSMTA
eukprot:g6128.t1